MFQRGPIAPAAGVTAQRNVTQRTHQSANHVSGDTVARELAKQRLRAKLMADFLA